MGSQSQAGGRASYPGGGYAGTMSEEGTRSGGNARRLARFRPVGTTPESGGGCFEDRDADRVNTRCWDARGASSTPRCVGDGGDCGLSVGQDVDADGQENDESSKG